MLPQSAIIVTNDSMDMETTVVQDDQNDLDIFKRICLEQGGVWTEDTYTNGVMHLENGTTIWLC